MSYDSTILADSPQGYWKLDEASGATVAIDSSGNGRDGELITSAHADYNAGIPIVYGVGGPIETDTYNVGMAGGVARAPVESALNTTGACSWEIWGFNSATPTAGTAVLLTRSSSAAGASGSHIRINGQTITGQVLVDSTGSTAYPVTYGNDLPWGTWFHIVLVRNGTALLLYVNGYLRDQRTDLPNDTLTLTNNRWGISFSPTGSGASSWGVARAAIYNTALSSGRVLAHYEAAKASLPLRATIVINLGVELNTDQIVPTDFGFAHNYSDPFGSGDVPIVEELSYATNVNQSEPDYQQRVSARPYGPLRTLEYHLTPSGYAARTRLQGELYEPARFYTLPVWSDVGVTTDLATGDTIPCDTTLRDYEVDSYCGICTDPSDPFTYEFAKILAVSDTELTLASDLSSSYSAGAYVFPARVVSISEDTLSVKSFAADHEASVIRFDVTESELSTRRITTYTPSTTYKSLEVFTLESAKYNFLDSRPCDISRRIQAHGRDYQYAMDSGSPQSFPVKFLLTSRTALSQFYGWLDARCGKLNPLFVSSKEHDYVVLARPSGSTLTVKKAGFSLHQGRRHLEILKTDGSFSRVKLTGIQNNGNGTETLTSTDGFPTLATIKRISFLKQCVLATDTIRIEHYKGGIAQTTINFKELLTSPT